MMDGGLFRKRSFKTHASPSGNVQAEKTLKTPQASGLGSPPAAPPHPTRRRTPQAKPPAPGLAPESPAVSLLARPATAGQQCTADSPSLLWASSFFRFGFLAHNYFQTFSDPDLGTQLFLGRAHNLFGARNYVWEGRATRPERTTPF